MRKQKSVWFLILGLGLMIALAGCGSDGNGGMTAMPDPDPDPDPPMQCPEGQTGTYPDCMTPPPPAPAGGHNAVIDGIVNPMTAGDPSTAQGTTATNRPGNATTPANAEMFNVTPGSLGVKPTTQVGTGDPNTATALNTDELDKDDMFGTPMKSLEGQFMNQNMDSMLGSFAGSVHEKMKGEGDDRTVDTLNVFTNAEAAKSATYDTYYTTADRDGVAGSHSSGVLTFATTTADTLDLFSGPSNRVPTGPNQNYNVPADDTGTTTVEENKFMGMFNGVPGTYACTTATTGCDLETNKDGHLTITGTLQFTPTETDLTKIMLPGVNYDSDYLSFGYWVRTTGEGDGTKYGVGTFFDGSEAYDITLGTLVGEATYSGKAAGMYGRKTLDQYGQVVAGSATSGHFTADAELMVRFGGDDIAENKKNQIEGTVSNFMDGGQMISPGWSAELKTIDLDGNGQSLTDFSGTNNTTGGGNWRGSFFGKPAETTPATPDAERHPTGVAGEFTAHFPNGHVIGAFGATKDDE